MEQNDIHQSVKVLGIAMLNNRNHIGVYMGNGEKERVERSNMFLERFNSLPGVVFLAKEKENIVGVMPTYQGCRIGSLLMARFCKEVDACKTKAWLETDLDNNVGFYEKFGLKVVSESVVFGVNYRDMLRDSQT